MPPSRVQLALNVPDLEAAVRLYSGLFGTEPAKFQRLGRRRPAIRHSRQRVFLREIQAGQFCGQRRRRYNRDPSGGHDDHRTGGHRRGPPPSQLG